MVQAVKALHTETEHSHLDLKVDNLLIGNDYRVKLCDLGLATPINEPILKKLGTDDYMAPEVFNVRETQVPYEGLKADIFSLGVILYILNFGIPPWKKPNVSQCRLYKRFKETR